MKDIVINFKDFINSNETALVGRETGRTIRKKLESKGLVFSSLEEKYESISINIPNDIITMNRSFFLAVFAERVKTLGKENFNAKYKFHASEYIMHKVFDHVDNALLDASPSKILNA